jgi:large subunit ribosomal protein L9
VGTKMKVLLVQDVEHLGQAGEIKDVAGGFGRNYLIPKGFAVLATRGQIKQAEQRLAAQRRRVEVARRDAEALAARLTGVSLRFEAKVGELDRLYGSVTSADIAARIHEQVGLEIDRRKIQLDDPIKRTGIYPITIRLMSDVTPVINVVVEGEGGAAAETPAAEEAETASITEPNEA